MDCDPLSCVCRPQVGLSMKAAEMIRRLIITTELEGGQPLVESRLAGLLGMSRTPVREALRQLEGEGLVRLIPNKGAFVSEISVDDLCDVYELRKAFESLAVVSALPNVTDEEIEGLRLEWERIYSGDTGTLPLEIITASDSSLHGLMISRCRNVRLRVFSDMLRSQIARYQFVAARSLSDVRTTAGEHLEIISLMKERNAYGLAAALTMHIEQSQRYIMEGYFAHQGFTFS